MRPASLMLLVSANPDPERNGDGLATFCSGVGVFQSFCLVGNCISTLQVTSSYPDSEIRVREGNSHMFLSTFFSSSSVARSNEQPKYDSRVEELSPKHPSMPPVPCQTALARDKGNTEARTEGLQIQNERLPLRGDVSRATHDGAEGIRLTRL